MSRRSPNGSTCRASACPKFGWWRTSRRQSSRRSTRCARRMTIASPPAGSGRPTTTSRSMRSRRRWGVEVVVHPEARETLERYYADKGGLNDGRLRMARVPEGAELIPNRMSGAPGIRIGNLFLMAGVPHITAGMLDALTGSLEGGRPVVSVTIGAPRSRRRPHHSRLRQDRRRAAPQPGRPSAGLPIAPRNWRRPVRP